MTFRLDCVPPKTTHHHKKIAHVGQWTRLVDRDELVAAKGLLEALLLPFRPTAPILGPVRLDVVFEWPWLAMHSKRVRAAGRMPHTSKPDLSNICKTLEDRLVVLGFLEDDRGVVDLHAMKWWTTRPGITITIEPCRWSLQHWERSDDSRP
jgi:Holliday junction resolvase RusA-like endonuclease